MTHYKTAIDLEMIMWTKLAICHTELNAVGETSLKILLLTPTSKHFFYLVFYVVVFTSGKN